MEFVHRPVLLGECIENLKLRPGGIYVDGTLGGGGHSFEICRILRNEGRLIGIDQDQAAIEAAGERLKPFGESVTIVRDNFSEFSRVMDDLGIDKVNGILLDLGVSSYQLDTVERGFSYKEDAPLDMRMDQRNSLYASDIVNTYSEEELKRILRDYGEEKFAPAIARRIVAARQEKTLTTTGELVDIVRASIPAKARREGGHPAKRTFQALRIECNHELAVLEEALGDMIDRLESGGRICVITFHSLEDRIVKNKFKEAQDPCICPKSFPVCVCGRKSKGQVITRKPILPGEKEMEENPRSKSSKLRVFEHV